MGKMIKISSCFGLIKFVDSNKRIFIIYLTGIKKFHSGINIERIE
jgi:hypothetical protein